MSCRGVEGLPFSFLVSLLVLALVLAGGFYLVDALNSFSSESSFLNDITRIKDRISFLKTGDAGSFSTISINIPVGGSLIFEGNNIKFGNYSVPAGAVFSTRTIFESGDYDLVLCYGVCEETDYLVEFE